jgi:hypothetical protein
MERFDRDGTFGQVEERLTAAAGRRPRPQDPGPT